MSISSSPSTLHPDDAVQGHSTTSEMDAALSEKAVEIKASSVADLERDQASSEPARRSVAPPDGGLKAWLVTFGGFCTMCCTLGYMNSFGVYQNYYGRHFLDDKSASTISWIGSLEGCLIFFGGVISGPLLDRFGTRRILIPSSMALVFSVMMTSLCQEYYQFILAQGLLEGIAFGLIYTLAMSTVGQYFVKRRALAMGVVATGASIGGIIWPIMTDRLLNASTVGFGWTVRLVGFIMLILLAFASAVMVEHAPRRKSRFLLPEAFRNKPYLLANLSLVLTFYGLWAPIFFIVNYTTSRGIDTSRGFYEVAVLNGMSFFGRIVSGYAADHVGRFNMLVVALLGSSILLFCWTATTTYAGVTIFTAFYGIFSGAVVSLWPPCIAQVCPTPSDIGTYIGMGLGLTSVTALTAAPIIGAIIERYSYLMASIFSAVMVLAGTLCCIGARMCLSKKFWVAV